MITWCEDIVDGPHLKSIMKRAKKFYKDGFYLEVEDRGRGLYHVAFKGPTLTRIGKIDIEIAKLKIIRDQASKKIWDLQAQIHPIFKKE